MMNGPHFILGTGRSGTMWLSVALSKAAGLDARHESVSEWDPGAVFGAVEVNSYLCGDGLAIRERYPRAKLVHLIRDGRAVVRSTLSRPPGYARPGRTFLAMCKMWRKRNNYLRKMVGSEQCYRLEDLTTDFLAFTELVEYLGGGAKKGRWQRLRESRVNASERYLWPHWRDWAEEDTDTFWRICGPTMRRHGYGGREE